MSPHEHEIEHAVEKQADGLAQKIALMTAVLATVGALVGGNYSIDQAALAVVGLGDFRQQPGSSLQ